MLTHLNQHLLRLRVVADHAVSLDQDGVCCGIGGDGELFGELVEDLRDPFVLAASEKDGEEGVEGERRDGGGEGWRGGTEGGEGLLGERCGGVGAEDCGEAGLGGGCGEVGGEERLGLVEAAGAGEAARGEGERVASGGGGEGSRVDGFEEGDGAVRVVLAAEAVLGECLRERGVASGGVGGGGGESAAEEGVGAAAAAEEKGSGCHFPGR